MDRLLYVGGYTRRAGKGIAALKMDTATGALTVLEVAPAAHPSYLCLSRDGRTLYAVEEYPLGPGQEGQVVAFRREGQGLRFLSRRPTGGGFPCHLETSPDGRFLFCMNYEDGSAAVFALTAAGDLGPRTALLRHAGRGPDPERQAGPHLHCGKITPDGQYIVLCDLGLDRVSVHALDKETGLGAEVSSVQCAPGAGARHVEFSPDGRHMALACEMGGAVALYRYGAGRLALCGCASTLPEGFRGENTVAAVRFSPDSRYLTVSNRGHDSLCTFRVEGETLSDRRFTPSGGQTPRDFCYAPGGRFLLAANEGGGGVRVFRAEADGSLIPTGQFADVPEATCICFAPEEDIL